MTPTSTRLRRVLTGGCAAGLSVSTVLGAGAAQAAGHTHRDAVHDVQSFGRTSKSPAPGDSTTDLIRLTTVYERKAVVFVVRVRGALPKRDYSAVGVFRLRSGDLWSAQVDQRRKLTTTLYDPHDDAKPCPGFSAAVSDRRSSLTLRVPTSCFPASPSLRSGFNLITGIGSGLSGKGRFHVDDAQRRGYAGQDEPALGPVIAQG